MATDDRERRQNPSEPQHLLPSPRQAMHKGAAAPLETQPGKTREKSDDHDNPNDSEDRDDAEQKKHKNDGDDNEKKEKKPFWKRPILLSVMIGVFLLLVTAGIVTWLLTRNYESTDDAFVDGRIIHIAPRVAGRVMSLNVNDNQRVEPDTVVIEIDPAPYQAMLDNAKATVAQAQSKVAQAQADLAVAQANTEQARAGVIVAESDAANADLDYERFQKLEAPARAQQQVDQITSRYRSAHAQLTEAQKRVTSAEAQAQSSQTTIEAARAQVLGAEAQVRQASLNLGYCKVTAGQAGYITRRTVEAGNYVQVAQEMMTVVSPSVWVTANFKETQLIYMRPNQPVEIEIDAFPQRKYRGHVDSIQTGTGAVFTTLPPENATGNFVKIVQRVPVKIVFDETIDHVLAPGESVDPRVDISSGR